MKKKTISAKYLEQQKQLHQDPDYGNNAALYAPLVVLYADQFDAKSISDYGAGKCSLQKKLNKLGRQDFKYFAYDPAFPDYGDPKQADLVCCLNVLEHVEPPYLNAVLQELRKTVKTICLITIQFGPSLISCPIVQNSHLIQKPTSWLIPKLCEYFEIVELESTERGFWVVLEPHSK